MSIAGDIGFLVGKNGYKPVITHSIRKHKYADAIWHFNEKFDSIQKDTDIVYIIQ